MSDSDRSVLLVEDIMVMIIMVRYGKMQMHAIEMQIEMSRAAVFANACHP